MVDPIIITELDRLDLGGTVLMSSDTLRGGTELISVDTLIGLTGGGQTGPKTFPGGLYLKPGGARSRAGSGASAGTSGTSGTRASNKFLIHGATGLVTSIGICACCCGVGSCCGITTGWVTTGIVVESGSPVTATAGGPPGSGAG